MSLSVLASHVSSHSDMPRPACQRPGGLSETTMSIAPSILQIIPDLDTGGAERTVIEVAEAIVCAGGRALLASEGGRLAGELAGVGGELIPFPAGTKNPAKIVRNARALATLIRAESIDLVHARSRAPAWSALIASRWTKRPFVTTYHGVYNQKSALKSWYNSVMARGDAVIANSQYTGRILRERHNTPAIRLHVIPRAVDLERFSLQSVSSARIASLKASWGIPANARVVLHAARLTRWKGQHLLIGAASRLKQTSSFDNAVIVIAGDHQGRAAYLDELRAAIEALGLNGKVVLAGHCTDMPAAFAAAYLTVIPSIEPEAFGRASIEAQAMGCPVIVSDGGALPETLAKAGRSGWTVPTGNEAALAQAIELALEMAPEQRSAMAAAAMDNADNFSKTVLQKKTLEVYDGLLAAGMANAFLNRIGSAEYAHHTA
jgi:glycosyltransferase involved in cell wall biosynthesis